MEPDRDSACTPQWLAELMGMYDLDPCSNGRSHILSKRRYDGSEGQCGLKRASRVPSRWRVFVNPPYSRGQVIRWIFHYLHVDFTFLLRWDPSTTWFRVLTESSRCSWHCSRRIEFDPPPGVVYTRNNFPHALYFKEDRKQVIRRMPRLEEWGSFTDF